MDATEAHMAFTHPQQKLKKTQFRLRGFIQFFEQFVHMRGRVAITRSSRPMVVALSCVPYSGRDTVDQIFQRES